MRKKEIVCLGTILGFALILRTIALDQFPYGFHFDEAKAAWNALSILKTGHDDQGNFLPWYYNSFGDWRPTGIFYMIIPWLVILGRSVWAVRLPAAIAGAATVVPLFLLMREIEGKKTITAWLAAVLLAVNPWHINTSRATSEVVVSIFLSVLGLYFLIKTIKKNDKLSAVLSISCLLSAFWFYHSIRVLAPLLSVAAVGFYYFQKQKKIRFNWSLATVVILSAISGIVLITMQGQGRFSQVSIKNDSLVDKELIDMPVQEGQNQVLLARIFHNKVTVLARRAGEEYFSYFGTDFLLGRSARPVRYLTTNFGLITYAEFIFFIAGLIATAIKPKSRLVWIWLLLAPIPAAVTREDTPNLHRSMMMVPFMVMIEAWGLTLILSIKNKLLTGGLILLWAGHFIYYLHFYYNHGNFGLSVYYRNGGMVELAREINEMQNKYDLIVLTNYSDSPAAWIAFFDGKDPAVFNKKMISLGEGRYKEENMIFGNQHCPSETAFKEYTNIKRLAVVDGEGCVIKTDTESKNNPMAAKIIHRKDNSPPFVVWERIK